MHKIIITATKSPPLPFIFAQMSDNQEVCVFEGSFDQQALGKVTRRKLGYLESSLDIVLFNLEISQTGDGEFSVDDEKSNHKQGCDDSKVEKNWKKTLEDKQKI